MEDRSKVKKLRAELRQRYNALLEPKITAHKEKVIRAEIERIDSDLKLIDKLTQVEIEPLRVSKKVCQICGVRLNTTKQYCSSLCRSEGLRIKRNKKTTQGNVRSGQTSPKK